MAIPQRDYDPRRLFVFSCPSLPFSKYKRTLGVYAAGALFALGHWLFWDAGILSAHAKPPADAPNDTIPVHVTFLDWTTGICSTLGLLIINLINKEHLMGQGGFHADDGIVWRARLFLFVGFALMAGGLAGSITILVLKYIIPNYEERFIYYGYANVVQNVALMLSAIVLWLAQHATNEYEYNLTL